MTRRFVPMWGLQTLAPSSRRFFSGETKISEKVKRFKPFFLGCVEKLFLCADDFWAHELGAVGAFSSGKRSNLGVAHRL